MIDYLMLSHLITSAMSAMFALCTTSHNSGGPHSSLSDTCLHRLHHRFGNSWMSQICLAQAASHMIWNLPPSSQCQAKLSRILRFTTFIPPSWCDVELCMLCWLTFSIFLAKSMPWITGVNCMLVSKLVSKVESDRQMQCYSRWKTNN